MSRAVAMLVAALLAAGSLGAASYGIVASADVPSVISRASFNPDGSVNLPVGYREWSHIGTRYKPDGTSILDGLPLQVPEVMNAYAEPGALARYRQDGKWPDGTQIVKEMTAIRTGAGCDATTRICETALGRGIFESGFMGVGFMVKDAARFPDAPGNWGYFSFGHKPPPYDSSSPVRSPAQCASCHVSLASDTDYVIKRAHVGLRVDGGQ